MVENIYCDPNNYTPNKKGIVGHQTQSMAWNQLGTPERMDKLAGYVDEAKALAKTDIEKKRVELFELATWKYMKSAVHRVESFERGEQWKDHPGTVERILNRPPALLATNALAGKPFEMETQGALFITQEEGETKTDRKSCPKYTDGKLEDIFIHAGETELSIRCDLGPVPPEGRKLRKVRIIWNISDGLRCRLAAQLFIREAATGEWRAISKVLEYDPHAHGLSGYCVLTLPFPEGAVTGFDALRLVDRSHLLKRPSTRFCEIEAECE
jgi:hypothetical protein